MKCALKSLAILQIATFAAAALAEPVTSWSDAVLRQHPEWYGLVEARVAADNVLIYQSEFGAWPKNWDLLESIKPEDLEKLNESGKANTIDNGATTMPLRFLALVHQASPDERYRVAFSRGAGLHNTHDTDSMGVWRDE